MTRIDQLLAEFKAKHAELHREWTAVVGTPSYVRKGVLDWLREEKIHVLHVTGPTEREEPGVQQAVRDALVWIFEDEIERPESRPAP